MNTQPLREASYPQTFALREIKLEGNGAGIIGYISGLYWDHGKCFRAALRQYIGFRVEGSGFSVWGNKPPTSRHEEYAPHYTMVQYWVGLLLGGWEVLVSGEGFAGGALGWV